MRVAASVRSKPQAVSGPEVPFDRRHSSILVSGLTCQDSEVATARTGVRRRGIDDLGREITDGRFGVDMPRSVPAQHQRPYRMFGLDHDVCNDVRSDPIEVMSERQGQCPP